MSASDRLVQGRYRLLRQVGETADATAWVAVDVALDRRVEVTLLERRLAGDPAAAERFRRAARAAAQSTTPGQPRVLDAGDDAASGVPFVVTEPADDRPAPPGLEATRPLPVVPSAPPVRAARTRAPEPAAGGRSLAGLLLLFAVLLLAGGLVVGGVVFGSRLIGRDTLGPAPSQSVADAPLGNSNGNSKPSPATDPSPTAVVAAPATATRPAVRAASSPTALAGARRRVVNTDGRGVALRASPGGDRLPEKGYDEGAVVTLLGQDGDWAHVRGDDGREGWVLAVTLAP